MENHFRANVLLEKNDCPENEVPFSLIRNIHTDSVFQVFHKKIALDSFQDFVSRLEQVGEEPRAGIPKIIDWGISERKEAFIEWEAVEGPTLHSRLEADP